MTVIDDALGDATTNATADAKDDNNTGTVAIPLQPAADIAVVTVVSGTAKQISATRNATVMIDITTSASFKLEMGPTSAAATTVATAASKALGVVTVRVPRGWYIKCTGTVTNYVVTALLD